MPKLLRLNKVAETKLDSVEELRHQVYLLKRRLEHTEVELVQARVSRDSWKAKYIAIMNPESDKPPEAGA